MKNRMRICKGCHKPTKDLSGTCPSCRHLIRQEYKQEVKEKWKGASLARKFKR